LFESNCESDDDFGWPRFHNLVELQASPWAVYFNDTYGALPSSADDYPICTFDFWHLQPGTDVAALGLTPDSKKAMGIPEGPQLPRAITNILSQRHLQTAYHYRKGEYVNGDLFQGGIDMGYMIYHDWYFYHQLPSNTWTEVVHTAAFQLETEAMWFQRAPLHSACWQICLWNGAGWHERRLSKWLESIAALRLRSSSAADKVPALRSCFFFEDLAQCMHIWLSSCRCLIGECRNLHVRQVPFLFGLSRSSKLVIARIGQTDLVTSGWSVPGLGRSAWCG